MPTREASLKVTLQPASFQAGLRRMTEMTRSAGVRMGRALKEPLSNGLKSAKNEFGNMVGSMKDGLKTVATLGGAVTLGGVVKSAVEAQSAYIALADQLSIATGRTVDQAEAQEMVERAALAAGESIETMRESMSQLAGVGDMGKVEDAMTRTALQAQRLRVPVDLVARATSRVMAKGLADSAQEAELLLETMNEFGRSVLGVDPDEAIDPNDIAEFAAFVNTTNSSVKDMTTLLGKTGDQVKDMGQAFEIVEELGLVLNTRKGLAELGKASRDARRATDLSKGSVENLLAILETGSPKAIKALEEAMGTDRAKAALGNILGEQLTIDIAAGKATREQIREVGTKLRTELAKAGDQQATLNRIQETNAKLAQTSGKKMQDALNRLQIAFSSPKVIAAVDKLADKLPALADAAADVVTWILDNPWESLAAVVGGRLALAFGGSLIQTAVANGLKGLFARAAAVQAASTAASVATGGASTLGVGGAIGATGAAGGTAAGLGAAAGAGAAVLAAGAVGAGVGYGIYKVGMEEKQVGEFKAMQGVEEALMTATTAMHSGSEEKLSQAILALNAAKTSMEQSESLTNTIFGTIASIATGGEVKSPAEMRSAKAGEIEAEEAKLRKALETLRRNAEVTASSLRKVGEGAETARGPMVPADPSPGASPVGG